MYRADSFLIYYINYLLSQLVNLNLHSKRFFVNKMKARQGKNDYQQTGYSNQTSNIKH